MTFPFAPLMPFKYGALLVDPPWSYAMRSEKGYAKSPEAHYGTMSDDAVMSLPVGHLASEHCLIFMWAVWPKLPLAMAALERWGFQYKTGGSWNKLTRTGKPTFGTGYILRSSCEPFLIGTIGAPVIGSRSMRNVINSERREHSRKPPEARVALEKLCPNAYRAELFAREAWAGNETWGNETEKFGEAA